MTFYVLNTEPWETGGEEGLTHHQSPIAQWLERATGIMQGHGYDSRWGLRKFFF